METDQVSYSCSYSRQSVLCGADFKTFEDLKQHECLFHDLHRCEVCYKQFASKNKLNKHLRNAHLEKWFCPECKYNRPKHHTNKINEHMATHLSDTKPTPKVTYVNNVQPASEPLPVVPALMDITTTLPDTSLFMGMSTQMLEDELKRLSQDTSLDQFLDLNHTVTSAEGDNNSISFARLSPLGDLSDSTDIYFASSPKSLSPILMKPSTSKQDAPVESPKEPPRVTSAILSPQVPLKPYTIPRKPSSQKKVLSKQMSKIKSKSKRTLKVKNTQSMKKKLKVKKRKQEVKAMKKKWDEILPIDSDTLDEELFPVDSNETCSDTPTTPPNISNVEPKSLKVEITRSPTTTKDGSPTSKIELTRSPTTTNDEPTTSKVELTKSSTTAAHEMTTSVPDASNTELDFALDLTIKKVSSSPILMPQQRTLDSWLKAKI